MNNCKSRYRVHFLNFLIMIAGLQVNAQLKAVTVGNKVPDLEIKNLINYTAKSVKLSAFKDKLLIIDFWGTTCSSCLAALPKIDSLQRKYKDKLQVLTVTNYDTKEKVTETFSRIKILKDVSLPIVLDDVKLIQLFPHELVSHVVWINSNGIVKAITGAEYITSENIEKVLRGDMINWPVKNDVFDFDYEKPIVSLADKRVQPSFLYHSVFTSNMPGIDATDKIMVDSVRGTITYNHFNHWLLQLCDGAVWGNGTGNSDVEAFILHVKDRGRYLQKESGLYYTEWAQRNTYTYSYTIPINISEEERKEFVKKDLSHWLALLGITATKENGKTVITEKN